MTADEKTNINDDRANSEVSQRFAEIVGKSLRIEPLLVTPDAYLDELGAESLDLIEITMEVESQFGIWVPEKPILDTAAEIYGPGVLERDGYLTEEGKRLMRRRMPAADAAAFTGEVAVKDLRRYFLKVSTWTRMIESLLEHTPRTCSTCGGAFHSSTGLRVKCAGCGLEVAVPSGEEINRAWVQEYYEKESGPREEENTETHSAAQEVKK